MQAFVFEVLRVSDAARAKVVAEKEHRDTVAVLADAIKESPVRTRHGTKGSKKHRRRTGL